MYGEDRAFGSTLSASEAAKQAAYATAGEATRDTARNALFDDVARNLKFASEIADRAERLANTVVGTVPTDADERQQGRDGSGGNGMLDALRSAASMQFRLLARISEALIRMERDLV